ncbi:hypothetical protein [Undibacterium oligocarboniphilum]|uniref:Uncharacterized protein n=1 Tax=Undibacterium oligocarboniphilum TaxID=666702 RepID=A0A850QI92_9BURK|nr:hypothetical protein [Undibacterium oligocarboniphilum]MBC3871416.1 hypothetical protein [Undibacterium oligocarboniphilum]NVO79008.1 hypothetical protein [Undibacterium oligocarboniphilum]
MYDQLGLENQRYRIFTLYPDLSKACESAISFIGTKFPGEKDVLIHEMLLDAFNGFKAASTGDSNPRHQFILGLCARAIYLYRIRYCANLELPGDVWTPMEQKITDFEKSHDHVTVLNEPDPQYIDQESASKLFAARILPGYLYREVFLSDSSYDNAA